MVFFSIALFARTTHVDSIFLPQDTEWHVKIKCTSCNENFPKEVTFTKLDKVQMSKQHGTSNFCITCKNCERKGFLKIQPTSPYKVQANEDNIIKGCLATFQSRGIQVTQVMMGNMFHVKVRGSPTIFDSCDFTDLWAQYDDIVGDAVQVQDQKIDIIRAK